ncbi:MAG: hydrogenase/urease maturation nickel metallochaperone HypA [Candidatus Altiarchaeota archaeon]
MHDITYAQEIVKVVLEKAEKPPSEIKNVKITVGKLLLLDSENLGFWVGELLKEKEISAEILVNTSNPELRCGCGFEGEVDFEELGHMTYLIGCPKCNRRDVEMIRGKQVTIDEITYR